MCNLYYINIVEKTSKKRLNHFVVSNASDITQAIGLIIQSYLNDSSINHIKTTFKNPIP